MKANPFAARKLQAFSRRTVHAGTATALPSKHPTVLPDESASGGSKTAGPTKHFLIYASLMSASFLVAVLFMLREIQHTRELYQMSQRIARAEAEARHWQEQERLEEFRKAKLIAIMHSPTAWPQAISSVKNYTVAMHWR